MAALFFLTRAVNGGRVTTSLRKAFVSSPTRYRYKHYAPQKRGNINNMCTSYYQEDTLTSRLFSTMQEIEQSTVSSIPTQQSRIVPDAEQFKVNLLTLPLSELETLLKSWGFPTYRGKQIRTRIFSQGITDFDEMNDLPKKLRTILKERATIGSLHLEIEQISQDGTKKRAYKLHDGQMIESVLMPYEDGRRTACISSQAGCAMGCVFCATGQMGFARQLTADEIYEQVARFATELQGEGERLSNVVMMGMGEPLANYRNVVGAIRRMNNELGIGARKITVSTVGVVPNIKKLMNEDIPVRLAVSLHCATDEERTALLPANRRYGGLDELMTTIREYVQTTKKRVTFEWALIEGQNDSKEVARTLGRLLQRHNIRSDMAHVNLIPLNPTGGFGGGPSGRANVKQFVDVLEREFSISATPRMRRGIDIDAGCGQLKAAVKKKEDQASLNLLPELGNLPVVGVYEDEEDNDSDTDETAGLRHGSVVDFSIDDGFVNLDEDGDSDDFIDPTFDNEWEVQEAERLVSLVKGITMAPPANEEEEIEDEVSSHPLANVPTTKITDDEALRKAKRRRKKLMKNIKAIEKLKGMEALGKVLNQEQMEKVAKEKEWNMELESVEHNLM